MLTDRTVLRDGFATIGHGCIRSTSSRRLYASGRRNVRRLPVAIRQTSRELSRTDQSRQIRPGRDSQQRRSPLLDRFFRLELRFRTLSAGGFFDFCEGPLNSRWRRISAPKTRLIGVSRGGCSELMTAYHGKSSSKNRYAGPFETEPEDGQSLIAGSFICRANGR